MKKTVISNPSHHLQDNELHEVLSEEEKQRVEFKIELPSHDKVGSNATPGVEQ